MNRGGWEDYDHSDQELDVYEQCCDNCTRDPCPMILPETAEDHIEEFGTLEGFDVDAAKQEMDEVIRRRREDASIRDGNLDWCIYWKERGGR